MSQNLKLNLFRTAFARKITDVQICQLRYLLVVQVVPKAVRASWLSSHLMKQNNLLERSLNRWDSTTKVLIKSFKISEILQNRLNHSRELLSEIILLLRWSFWWSPDSRLSDLVHWSSTITLSTGFNINCGRSRCWSNLKINSISILQRSVRFGWLSWC